MNNKGIILYKENFINKFKNFLKRLFRKEQRNYCEISNENNVIQKQLNKFSDEMKVDITNKELLYTEKSFLKDIDGNIEALNMLSVDRLRKLEKYYEKIIKQNNEKIQQLKN